MIRVAILDERILFRESLRTILMQHDREFEVTGVTTCQEFCNENVDVLLFVLTQPFLEVMEKIREIKYTDPKIRMIIMDPAFTAGTFYSALQIGVDGYVLQDITLDELSMAIKSVTQGLGVIQKRLLVEFADQIKGIQARKTQILAEKLTERERELIRLIVEGKSNKEIASTLCIALGTVKNTLSVIFDKLQSKDRTQLAICAIQNKLV